MAIAFSPRRLFTREEFQRAGEAGLFRPDERLALIAGEPEPDVAVVAGEPRAFVSAHPTSALLVVEVSDTTLAFDRAASTRAVGHQYRSVVRLTDADEITPRAASASIPVADLLP